MPAKRKLSFKEQRELDALPTAVESLEAQVTAATEQMNSATFYQQGNAQVQAAKLQLAGLRAELDKAYARWSELE